MKSQARRQSDKRDTVRRTLALHPVRVAACVALIAMVLSACSSSSKSGSSTAGSSTTAGSPTSEGGSGTQATGSPVKVGTINSVGVPALDYPDMVAAVRAAARDLNAHGGLAGHPIEVDFCNSAGTANGEASCAQKLVSDHVVATIGDLTPFSPDTTAILRQGGIARIGIVPENPPDEFNAPNVFLFDGGPAFDYAAVPQLAKMLGYKSMVLVTLAASAGSALVTLTNEAAQKTGVKVASTILMPASVADFTPYAAQVQRQNVQLVSIGQIETNVIGLMKALGSLGVQTHYAINNTILEQSDYALIGEPANSLYIVGRMPPFSAQAQFPALGHFIEDMNAEAAAGDSAAQMSKVRPIAVEPWLALLALPEALSQAHVTDVTASTVMSAMNSAKSLNMQGITPDWTPSNPGPPNYARVAQAYEYFIKVQNGQTSLVQPQPYNVSKLLGGS